VWAPGLPVPCYTCGYIAYQPYFIRRFYNIYSTQDSGLRLAVVSCVWCDGEERARPARPPRHDRLGVPRARRMPGIANAVRHPAGFPRALRFVPCRPRGWGSVGFSTCLLVVVACAPISAVRDGSRLACPRRPCCAVLRPPIRAQRGMHLSYNFSGCSRQTTDPFQWRRCLCAAFHVETDLLSYAHGECVHFFLFLFHDACMQRPIFVCKKTSGTHVRINPVFWGRHGTHNLARSKHGTAEEP
jgi:hypothetical protein